MEALLRTSFGVIGLFTHGLDSFLHVTDVLKAEY